MIVAVFALTAAAVVAAAVVVAVVAMMTCLHLTVWRFERCRIVPPLTPPAYDK